MPLHFLRHGQIEDKNGAEDFSLATLTEEELTQLNPTFYAIGAKTTSRADFCCYTVKKLSGVKPLFSVFLNAGETCEVSVSTGRSAGNLRIFVYLAEEKRILSTVEIGKDVLVRISAEKSGDYEIRAAAESAEFSVEIFDRRSY